MKKTQVLSFCRDASRYTYPSCPRSCVAFLFRRFHAYSEEETHILMISSLNVLFVWQLMLRVLWLDCTWFLTVPDRNMRWAIWAFPICALESAVVKGNCCCIFVSLMFVYCLHYWTCEKSQKIILNCEVGRSHQWQLAVELSGSLNTVSHLNS